MQGDDTIETRLQLFQHQRDVLNQQIAEMKRTLETVEYKCWFYETAKAAGTVDVPPTWRRKRCRSDSGSSGGNCGTATNPDGAEKAGSPCGARTSGFAFRGRWR